MIDLDKAIASAVKTGKVSFGTRIAKQSAETGRAKLIILAANCPKDVGEEIKRSSQMSQVPLITFRGSALDLAAVCGRPFSVAVLTVREAGDSEILKVMEPVQSEEANEGNE